MAIIICPNCGNEISDKAPICHHCKTPMSVILSQNPKKKRTTPIAVPILSVLDGLVLLGTVGLLTWGVMNPAVAASLPTESVSSSTDLAVACETISTLQRNAAKNYNRYYSDDTATAENPAPIAKPATEPEAVELAENQDALPVNETTQSAVQSETQQQAAPESKRSASAQETTPNQVPGSNSGTPTGNLSTNSSSPEKSEASTTQTTQTTNSAQASGANAAGNGNNFNTYNNQEQTKTDAKWVLNTSSKKIHYPTCRDVPKIAPQNYSTSNEDESDLLDQGYTTCGHCH